MCDMHNTTAEQPSSLGRWPSATCYEVSETPAFNPSRYPRPGLSFIPARSGFPERRPGRPRTAAPAGAGWGRGPEGGEPCASRSAPAAAVPPRPSDRGRGALLPPGGPPAAVPETRAGGGGCPRRPHRPPRPSGRSPLTSANFLAPLGGAERTRARAASGPRPGWASRLLVGAPGHPPAQAGQMAGRFTAPLHDAPS